VALPDGGGAQAVLERVPEMHAAVATDLVVVVEDAP
jgi:hypothetical protein